MWTFSPIVVRSFSMYQMSPVPADPKPKKGLPVWAIILIIVSVITVSFCAIISISIMKFAQNKVYERAHVDIYTNVSHGELTINKQSVPIDDQGHAALDMSVGETLVTWNATPLTPFTCYIQVNKYGSINLRSDCDKHFVSSVTFSGTMNNKIGIFATFEDFPAKDQSQIQQIISTNIDQANNQPELRSQIPANTPLLLKNGDKQQDITTSPNITTAQFSYINTTIFPCNSNTCLVSLPSFTLTTSNQYDWYLPMVPQFIWHLKNADNDWQTSFATNTKLVQPPLWLHLVANNGQWQLMDTHAIINYPAYATCRYVSSYLNIPYDTTYDDLHAIYTDLPDGCRAQVNITKRNIYDGDPHTFEVHHGVLYITDTKDQRDFPWAPVASST
jgi:hypothetical protein